MKRILWILNHKTLMKFEVPLLRKLGYEVYIPKKPPFDVSVSVDWESDKLLSIPQKDLDIINSIDFYEDTLTPKEADLINKYFHIAMFIHTPKTIESMVDWFKGVLVLRAYGRMEAEGSYTDVILSFLGLGYMKKIESLGFRFVFGESYRGLSKIECEFFRNHTLYMPIGLPDCKFEDKWTGEKKKMLFICPRIRYSGLFEKTYKKFKEEFKDLPYSIGGVQPIEVQNDPNVLGFLPQKEYDLLYPSHSCLYYDSTEKNHITYPPLEAVKCGLPVIFMGGGLLDELGGKNLPGRCKNVHEAKKKIKKLISGDKILAKNIRNSQIILLEKFKLEYCLPIWEKAMKEIESYCDFLPVPMFGKKRKRLCIMLPEGYTGGVLDYTIRIIEAIKKGSEAAGDMLDIVFAYLDCPVFQEMDYFKPIRKMGVPIRKFQWKRYSYDQVLEIYQLMGIHYHPYPEDYFIPEDGSSNFSDCDHILLTVDRVPGSVLFFQPYGLISHDYIQRILPDLFDDIGFLETPYLHVARNAKAIFTSTDVTKDHTIQYAGVAEKRVHLIPVPFSAPKGDFQYALNNFIDDSYFVWSTNIASHKNHEIALEAISTYYLMGGRLKCVVTGVNTQYFDPEKEIDEDSIFCTKYVLKIRDIVNKNKLLKDNILFLGNLPKFQYRCILKNAKFFFHPGSADNGNGTAFDAAYLGVPTISSDYRAMRFYDSYFPLNMKFFDNTDPDNITSVLLEADKENEEFRSHLPSKETMEKKMVDHPDIYIPLYDQIKTHLAIDGGTGR